jgi:phosphoribosylanthranilate isomerase
MTPVQIKICGVTNVEDAKACVELGAQMIGLNFDPQSPRYIERTVAGQIVQAIRPGVQAVGVFVDTNAHEVRDAASIAGIRSVQLHGNFSPEIGRELAREFRVIRAFSTHAQNVGRAITAVTPDAVDVCSGVESAPGAKDYRAIASFIAVVRMADAAVNVSHS